MGMARAMSCERRRTVREKPTGRTDDRRRGEWSISGEAGIATGRAVGNVVRAATERGGLVHSRLFFCRSQTAFGNEVERNASFWLLNFAPAGGDPDGKGNGYSIRFRGERHSVPCSPGDGGSGMIMRKVTLREL